MATALVFCPNSSGHRQVYTAIYADFLRRRGLDVTVALGEATPGEAPAASSVVGALMRGGGVQLLRKGVRARSGGARRGLEPASYGHLQ